MPKTQEELAQLVERDGASPEVVEAFRSVAREDFVPDRGRREAYLDRPVALPEHQTTSQPSLIGRMIDALELGPEDRVLEVGTGYGFQTALLSKLAGEVYSIERHEDLAEMARSNLARSGIDSVHVEVGDGWQGLPEHAPFDAIVVSAAAVGVPPALIDQLAEGGRMVIPLAGPREDEVVLFEKRGGRLPRVRLITPARFVPLVPGPP
ncbi:MAG TPA: protein-L-isoaspartate(D-aspartate) O-methyltransferase [Actinomycetota bacterium]|nr:protein-L-isoaspartate(D-aspartate) O-methyltransferase [Actinomycetota bacterium]